MFLPASAGIDRRRSIKLIGYSALFLLCAYVPFLAPPQAANFPGLMIFWSFFCTSVITLCDETTMLLERRSLMDEVLGGRQKFFDFVATGAACGLLLDGVAQWMGKLWVYPYWNLAIYVATFILGFCTYWLLLMETWMAGSALLRGLTRWRDRQPPAWTPLAFRAAEVSGAVLLACGLGIAMRDYLAWGGHRFDIEFLSKPAAPFRCLPLICFGVWLLLESVNYRQGRDSLLATMLRREWLPVAAMLFTAWTFGFFMETVNTAQHFWRYTNWPLGNYRAFGVPVLVLVLWPLQYLVFGSVYEAISGKNYLLR